MSDNLTRVALRTSFLYAIFAALWIGLSGLALVVFVRDPHTAGKLEIYKGWAFVVVTAFLLYAALRRQMRWLKKEMDARKQVEQQMCESEERFSTIFRSSPMGITVSRLEDGRLVDANSALLSMVGCSREEVMGHTSSDLGVFASPEDRKRLVEAVLARGTVQGTELPFRKKSGEMGTMLGAADLIYLKGEGHLLGMALDITERKRAEESLRTSQLQLSEAMDMARLAYWEADGSTGVFTFSDAFYDLIGTSAEREGGYTMPIEQYFRKFVHPDDLSRVLRFAEVMRAEGGSDGPADFEARVIRGDGEVCHILTRLRVFRDQAGPSVKIFGINQDVTDRKKTKDALRQSEELHRMLAENASDMIWIEDERSGRLTYVSPSVYRLTGYSAQEVMELPTEDRIAPSSLAVVREHRSKAVESASRGQRIENERLELENLCKDGSTIWMETIAGGMYDASGDLVAMHGVSRDITERRRAEEALRTSRLQLSDAMDLARIVYWELDGVTETFIFNDPFYAFLATTADREGGYRMSPPEYLSRFVHPDDRTLVQQAMKRSVSGQDVEFLPDAEHRIVRRDGETRHILVRSRVFKDAMGRTVRCYGANQDITERKRAEEALSKKAAFFEALVNTSFDGILVVDGGGKKIFQNQKTAELWGIPQHVLGRGNLAQVQHATNAAKDPEQFAERVMQIYAHPDEPSLDEVELTNGTTLERYSSAVLGQDGEYYGRIWGFHDITERKRAEEALRESEVLYRSLVDTTNTGYVIIDQAGKVLDANQEYVKLSGHNDLNEIRGRSVVEWTADHEKEKNAKAVAQCAREGYVRNLEIDYVDSHGKVTPIEINATVVEKDGMPQLLTLCRDITERRQAEEALSEKHRELHDTVQQLEQSRNTLQLIIESIPIRVFWKDKDLRFLGCNGLFARDAGLSHPQQILGEDDFAMGWRDQADLYRIDDRHVMESRRPKMNIVEPQTTPEGTTIWLNTSKVPLEKPDGEVFGVLGIYEDITDRKRAEEELKLASAYNRRLIEASLDPFVTIGPDGKITDVNAVAEQVTGHPREELIGTDHSDYFTDPEKARVGYRQAFREGTVRDYELEIRHRDGHVTPVLYNASVYRDDAGQIVGIFAAARDITERKQAQEKLGTTLNNLRKAIGGTIQAIVQVVEMRDPYTAGHQRRVADLARSIATEMRLPSDVIEGIRIGAVIHDIGKVSVPAEILSKPGKLTQNEFELVKDHAATGYEILKDVEFPWPIAEIIYQHHERLDGSGYPRGLKGDDVLLEARIIALADVVEAMASHRPFRPARGVDAALDEIRKNRGILYDPEVVDACVKLFRKKGYALTDREEVLIQQLS